MKSHHLVIGNHGTLTNVPYLLVQADPSLKAGPIVEVLTSLRARHPIPVVLLPIAPLSEMRDTLTLFRQNLLEVFSLRLIMRTNQKPDLAWDAMDWVIYEETIRDYDGTMADELVLTWQPGDLSIEGLPKRAAANMPVTIVPSGTGQMDDVLAFALRQPFRVNVGRP